MKYRSGYEQGKLEGAWVGNQLKDADKIRQELNKPVIPQFVAVWIEECKAKGKNLLRALLYTPEKVNSWVDDPDNQEIFALAWMFGYTVENEKRYTVVMKETNGLNIWQMCRIAELEEKRPIIVYKADNSGAEIKGRVTHKEKIGDMYTITVQNYGIFVVTQTSYESLKIGDEVRL
ncbi:DUF1372 family protein [Streptococcus sp. 151470009-6]